MVVLIAESLNVMSKSIGPALRNRDPEPVKAMAKAEDAAGADYIDINIGPARKAGDELMSWAVKTVQEVTNKPLSLDTTNPIAMEAGLKVHRGKALINSISPVRADEELPFVRKYGAYMVGLLWGVDGMPRDAAERGVIAAELLYKANEAGITNEEIWIDPIASPVSVEINQVKACFEFMSMLQDIAPGCKSTVGLSNISNGTPDKLRPWLNRTFLMMLMKYDIYSAIVDVFDTELVKIAKGQCPDLVSFVHRMMDGEEHDISTLSEEQVKYTKTVRVLMGKTLYSHSWLEV
ncbi:MAG: dihydropteroate synthase [Chloroflexi bacterium]|nr:dihydropteroate synthase [Chloroflexota bacterium]